MAANTTPLIKNKDRSTFRIFILIFLSFGLLLTCAIAIAYNLEKRDYLEKVMANEAFNIELQRESINKIFGTIYADLIFISKQNELMLLLKTNNPMYKNLMNQEYFEFINQKSIYDQVRFIDDNGIEICRVNFNDNDPEIIKPSDLQNKSKRYYFEDTLNLNQGEIFASPFDLNIEEGAIEKPMKPMIRFGTPVMDTVGRKRGVIILNYLGDKLIQTLKENAKLSPGKIMLVNAEGYWLIGASPEDEWGFMFPDKTNRRFQTAFPEKWQTISNKISVQLYTNDGLFTSTTIYPLRRDIITSTGASKAYEKSKKQMDASKYYWKLISFVAPEVLHSETKGLLTILMLMGILLFLFSSIPSHLIANGIVKRRLHQQELIHLATFDQLTNLPNRFLFFDRLDQALKQASRYKRQFALLFLDLDGFKQVNDSLGHEAGDELLSQTAKRLVNAVRKADTVARLAGDEFTIILTDIQSPKDPENFAQKILTELSAPFTIQQKEVNITASIGIGIFSIGEETPETLLKKSDSAMYEAKREGKNTYKVFDDAS